MVVLFDNLMKQVRLDSRVRCSGNVSEQQEQGSNNNNNNNLKSASPSVAITAKHKTPTTIDAKSLIQEHFTPNTINLVILGGGPVGLYFANAMTQQQQYPQGLVVVPPMRILIIENRVH